MLPACLCPGRHAISPQVGCSVKLARAAVSGSCPVLLGRITQWLSPKSPLQVHSQPVPLPTPMSLWTSGPRRAQEGGDSRCWRKQESTRQTLGAKANPAFIS